MIKCRKFNRRLASKIMAGKVKGRIRTRDGRPVRILAWDAIGGYPIVGLVFMGEVDTELSWQWTRKGIPLGHSEHNTLDFTLVLELSSNVRHRRVTNKKKRK